MKRFNLLLFAVLILTESLFSNGYLVVIGGGKRPERIMQKIVNLAGNESSKILVIPMASSEPVEVAEYQVNQFRENGAVICDYLYCTKEEANEDSIINKVKNYNCIFFSGGDQNRLIAVLNGTKLLKEIKNIFAKGGVISGTSAGAAVMSEIMITGDELKHSDEENAFATIEKANIKTDLGFGFLNNVIIDQHFIYRKRFNRLLSLVLENPNLTGIGIDESTAIVINPEKKLTVIGDYQVQIIDAAKAKKITSNEKGLFSAEGIITHILYENDKYDLITNSVIK